MNIMILFGFMLCLTGCNMHDYNTERYTILINANNTERCTISCNELKQDFDCLHGYPTWSEVYNGTRIIFSSCRCTILDCYKEQLRE